MLFYHVYILIIYITRQYNNLWKHYGWIISCQSKISLFYARNHELVLDQHPQQQVITVPTRKILHPRLDVTAITYIQDITKSVYNMTQAKTSMARHPIFPTCSDYNYILKEVDRQENIKFEVNVEVLSDDEEN